MNLEKAFREFDWEFFSKNVYQRDKTKRELLGEYWDKFGKEFNWAPTAIWDPKDLVAWWNHMWDETDAQIEKDALEAIGVPKKYL